MRRLYNKDDPLEHYANKTCHTFPGVLFNFPLMLNNAKLDSNRHDATMVPEGICGPHSNYQVNFVPVVPD